MKRSPLTRSTPLKRSGPIQPKWPPQGSREKRAKRLSRSKMPSTVQDAVRRRSRGVCELCGSAPAAHLHHRRLRSQGGQNTYENLADLCHACHNSSDDAVHANVDWARRHGWIVPSWADPAEVDTVVGCPIDCLVDHTAKLS